MIWFKAKRINKDEWVEGYYFKVPPYTLNNPWGPTFEEENSSWGYKVEDRHGIFTEDGHYEVDPETVCQYTDLDDSSGEKIFRGDILSLEMDNGERWRATVAFGNPNTLYDWGWQLIMDNDYNKSILLWVEADGVECCVIGNIYDKK